MIVDDKRNWGNRQWKRCEELCSVGCNSLITYVCDWNHWQKFRNFRTKNLKILILVDEELIVWYVLFVSSLVYFSTVKRCYLYPWQWVKHLSGMPQRKLTRLKKWNYRGRYVLEFIPILSRIFKRLFTVHWVFRSLVIFQLNHFKGNISPEFSLHARFDLHTGMILTTPNEKVCSEILRRFVHGVEIWKRNFLFRLLRSVCCLQ